VIFGRGDHALFVSKTMNELPLYLSDLIANPPASPGILPSDSLAEAGLKTWRFHFVDVLRHEPGTRLGQDIEALHDMRVATRRLRAAFDVFGGAFDPKSLHPYLKGLRATGRALGRARDMDVFTQNANTYRDSLPARQRASLLPLLENWQAERAEARQAMIVYLDSDAYQQFLISFASFLQPQEDVFPPFPRNGPRDGSPLRLVIPGLIFARLNDVMAYDVLLPKIKMAQLHALRIEFKRLRYTVEFFREVLGKPSKPVIAMIKNLQDHLGMLQDTNVAAGVLRAWLDRWDEQQAALPLSKRQGPIGILAYLSYQYATRQQLMSSFPKVWGEFTRPEFQQSIAGMIAVL
jgi:CHAD domain-containing protein